MTCRAAIVAAVALGLAACGPSARVTHGSGPGILQAQTEPALHGKYRIAVAEVIDKTDALAEQGLVRQLNRLNAGREAAQQLQPNAITAGVRDMLLTELFASGQFIVLEREGLDAILVEQAFAESARVGERTRIPRGELEGAELLLLAAITGFDAGLDGGALPIPVPFKLGRHQDFGLLSVSYKRGWVAMDVRVVEARTGRVLAATSVEGRNTRWGLDFTGFVDVGYRIRRLPNVLSYFANTPVEQALQDMVELAVAQITARDEARP